MELYHFVSVKQQNFQIYQLWFNIWLWKVKGGKGMEKLGAFQNYCFIISFQQFTNIHYKKWKILKFLASTTNSNFLEINALLRNAVLMSYREWFAVSTPQQGCRKIHLILIIASGETMSILYKLLSFQLLTPN